MALSLEETDKLIEARKRLKAVKLDICKQCKKNFELEREVRFFDQRIALLINHRISVEEFSENCMSFGEHRVGIIKDDLQRQNFGNLFFLLQTEPHYLATLTRSVSPSEIDELLQTVMFSLYGNQYEAREEHLLLKMFELALQKEFQQQDEFNNLLRANTAISRMMTTYTRRGPGQEYLKANLGRQIQEMAADHTLSLEANPIKVYAEVHGIDDDEQNNVTFETAMQDPRVAHIVKVRLKALENTASKFLDAIINSLHCVPYGIRWLCKAIRQLCKDKFPFISSESVTCLIGGFFMLRFINPSIVTPHAYMLLPSQPRQTTRRNLVLVAKILQAISNKHILKEHHMQPLKQFVEEKGKRLQIFLNELCDIEDFHSFLEIEQFLSLPRDMFITINLKEMYRIHCLLCKYRSKLIIEKNDKLDNILNDIGTPILPSSVKDDIAVELNLRFDKVPEVNSEVPNFQKTLERGAPALRKQCRKILIKLFSMTPSLMQEVTLSAVLQKSTTHEDPEVRRLLELASSHLEALRELDRRYSEDGFYNSVKEKVMEQELQYDRISLEIKSLKDVHENLCWHGDFLSKQLDAYKEYLTAVRNKAAYRDAGVSVRKPSNARPVNGPLKFPFTSLEKEGVIIETRAIPEKRKNNIYLMLTSPEPGIYKIALHFKVPIPGQSQTLELELHLEELLELQHFRDPVLNLNEFVLLDVRRTLTFLQKNFSAR